MRKIAILSNSERRELFQTTAIRMGIRPEVVEKDFWVCFMLDYLFHECKYHKAFVFKGGTSLSKSYHVIKRFSEDIDLILDWREIIKDASNPWDMRTKTKQNLYNKQINHIAAVFYKEQLVPELNKGLKGILGESNWSAVDKDDSMVINFYYPRVFETEYILPSVRLEIGPLAEWFPSHNTNIVPFAAELYPELFEVPSTDVLTIDAERTFWEKITILHKIAHFSAEKILPYRYARHLYDVYCLANSTIKQSAFEKKELLEKDIAFKQKFYYSKGAHYETATIKNVCLIPSEPIMQSLRNDYVAMKNMIYGDAPEFEDIIEQLKKLENEIHTL